MVQLTRPSNFQGTPNRKTQTTLKSELASGHEQNLFSKKCKNDSVDIFRGRLSWLAAAFEYALN